MSNRKLNCTRSVRHCAHTKQRRHKHSFYAYLIGTSIQCLPNWHEHLTLTKLAWAFNAYPIGTSVWRLPNWHEHLTLTKLAWAFDASSIGTSIRRLPNWHKRSTLTQLAWAFDAYLFSKFKGPKVISSVALLQPSLLFFVLSPTKKNPLLHLI